MWPFTKGHIYIWPYEWDGVTETVRVRENVTHNNNKKDKSLHLGIIDFDLWL